MLYEVITITEEARLRLTDTPVLTFKALDSLPFIRHGLSTRLGGVSDDVWQSMNLGFTRGDDENKVRENFKRICKAIGIKDNKLISVSQVHRITSYNVCYTKLLREICSTVPRHPE